MTLLTAVISAKRRPDLSVGGWDTSRKGAGITVTSSKRVATRLGVSGWQSVFGQQARSSGKYYFEVYINDAAVEYAVVGVGTALASLNDLLGQVTNTDCSGGLWNNNGGGSVCEFFDKLTGVFIGGSGGSGGLSPSPNTPFGNGSTFGVAMDMGANSVTVLVDNVARITRGIAAGKTWYPAASMYLETVQLTARFTASEMLYLPSGYAAWQS